MENLAEITLLLGFVLSCLKFIWKIELDKNTKHKKHKNMHKKKSGKKYKKKPSTTPNSRRHK